MQTILTPISGHESVPLKLQINQQFAIQREPVGRVISVLRENSARMLAQKVMGEEKFFDLKVEQTFGNLRVDVVVMTQKEYADLCREQFRAGMDHAQGFRPRDFELKEQP